jgi:hypothetical protein
MSGVGDMIDRSGRRVATRATLAAVALAVFVPATASATVFTVHTNRGGTCHLQTIAKRAGTQIQYGIRVRQCPTKFGVRYVVSQGILYDVDNSNLPVPNGYLGRMKGHLPYQHSRSVSGTAPGDTYRTRIDLTIVLKAQRDAGTRKPERWTDSGKSCLVKTTRHNGDTLGCELGDTLPGA